MSITYKPYLDQNYDKIKSDCLRAKKLFEDDTFPADWSSIYKFQTPEFFNSQQVTWKRPYEFLDNISPEFIVDSIVPEDIDQGQLGNWSEKCIIVFVCSI